MQDDIGETLRDIWDRAENMCELAAARNRLLISKLPPLPTTDNVPQWFDDCCEAWDHEDRQTLNPASLLAAEKIIKCVASTIPELKAEVSVGMLGRVVLDWYSVDRRKWMIEPTDLPFPSTRIYEAREGSSKHIKTRIIHDMYQAIDLLQGATPLVEHK